MTSNDVREGGAWSALQALKNACIYTAIRSALWLADRVPERLLCALGRGLGRTAWRIFGAARRIAERDVAQALPHVDPVATVRRSFETAGHNLALTLMLRRPSTTILRRVVIGAQARSQLALARDGGRGALVASAHFGPFELIAPAVSALGLSTSIVVRESYDRRLDAIVDHHRVVHGVEVIHRGRLRTSRAILRSVRQTLGCHGLVGLLVDLPGRGTRRTGTLFGVRNRLAAGPAVLGARLGVPVLVSLLHPMPDGERYELVVQRVTEDADPSRAIGLALERAARAWPEQWLWMGDPLGLRSRLADGDHFKRGS